MKGFTLIELLLVIAIVLSLGTMGTIFYSRMLNQTSVANVSDQITEQMHKAQIYAMAGKQNTSWGVKYASSKITLFATGNSAFDENFDVGSTIAITGFSVPVTFGGGTGLPDTTPTINISGGGNSKTLTVNSQGMIAR